MSITGIQGQPLEVTVVACYKLKDTEWISRQDPYVCVEYGSTKFRTRTCTDGGKNPTFQEKFIFPLIEGLRELNVVVWNSNTLTFDDFIGSGKVQLHKVLSLGFDDSAWPLQTKTGRHAGEVKLILHYANPMKSESSHVPSAPPYVPPATPHVPLYSVPSPAPAISYSPPPSASSYLPTGSAPSYPPVASTVSYPPTTTAYRSPYSSAYPPSSYPASSAYAPSPYPASSPYPSYSSPYPPSSYPPPTSYPPAAAHPPPLYPPPAGYPPGIYPPPPY